MNEKDFAMRLAMLRRKKKVSAREMSLAIGQNPNYVNHIETGGASASLSGIFYICEYLGVTPSEFFDLNLSNPARLNRINHFLKKLDDDELEIIEKLVMNFYKKKK